MSAASTSQENRPEILRLMLFFVIAFVSALGDSPVGAAATVDNSQLIPKLLPDSAVKLERDSPDWGKTLIMAEVRLETALPDGTILHP